MLLGPTGSFKMQRQFAPSQSKCRKLVLYLTINNLEESFFVTTHSPTHCLQHVCVCISIYIYKHVLEYTQLERLHPEHYLPGNLESSDI